MVGGPRCCWEAADGHSFPGGILSGRRRTGDLLYKLYVCGCVFGVWRGRGLIDSLSDWRTVKRRPQSDLP